MIKPFTLLGVILLLLTISIRSFAVTPLNSHLPPLNSQSVGMGYSGAALITDPSIIYWNPAGLILLDQQSMDITTIYPNLNVPTSGSMLIANHLQSKKEMLGVGVMGRYARFVTSSDTTDLTSWSLFNPIAFAIPKLERMPLGITPKIITEKENDGWKVGYAIDVGLMVKVLDDFYGGVTIQNLFGSPLRSFKRDAWAGVSYGNYLSPLTLAASVGLEKPRRRSYLAKNFAYGASWKIGKKIPELRAGYTRRDETGWITSGLSFTVPKDHTHLDYSIIVNIANRKDTVQYLTWGYTIGPDPVEKALRDMR